MRRQGLDDVSSNSPEECFVYNTLPGQTEAVTAGRFQLTADRSGLPVGRFIHGRSHLERRETLEIDPVELRLARGVTYETAAMKGREGDTHARFESKHTSNCPTGHRDQSE